MGNNWQGMEDIDDNGSFQRFPETVVGIMGFDRSLLMRSMTWQQDL